MPNLVERREVAGYSYTPTELELGTEALGCALGVTLCPAGEQDVISHISRYSDLTPVQNRKTGGTKVMRLGYLRLSPLFFGRYGEVHDKGQGPEEESLSPYTLLEQVDIQRQMMLNPEHFSSRGLRILRYPEKMLVSVFDESQLRPVDYQESECQSPSLKQGAEAELSISYQKTDLYVIGDEPENPRPFSDKLEFLLMVEGRKTSLGHLLKRRSVRSIKREYQLLADTSTSVILSYIQKYLLGIFEMPAGIKT